MLDTKTFFRPYNINDDRDLTDMFVDVLLNELPREEQMKFYCWWKHRDVVSLLAYQVDYSKCWSPREFAALRQVLSLFQKDDSLDIGVDKELNGLRKFLDAEYRCKQFNDEIRLGQHDGRLRNSDREALLFSASYKFRRILNDDSCPSIEDLPCAFGPGANTNVRGKTSARRKLNAQPCCSKELKPLYLDILKTYPTWLTQHSLPTVVHGVLSFVSKNAEVKRSIMMEPGLNGFIQKGIGSVIRESFLRETGIDLRHSQDIHRDLAMEGSLTQSFGTLDEVSASDMIAYMLVSELSGERWFDLLASCRTGTVDYSYKGSDGKEIKTVTLELEKFSSMGNGFTFELESVIFYSIAWGAIFNFDGSRNPLIRVYGDDIIVETQYFDVVAAALALCGFEVNTKKSYNSGFFRESCGGDFLYGIDIRPFYKKELWSPARLHGLYNFVYAKRGTESFFPELMKIAQVYLALTQETLFWGPEGYGDGHLHDESWFIGSRARSDYDDHYSRSKVVKWLARQTCDSLETNHFFSVIAVPKKDRAPLKIGDRLFPYYSLKPSSEKEDLLAYLDGRKRLHDPYSLRGQEAARRIVIQQPGHLPVIQFIFDIEEALVVLTKAQDNDV